jgi:hypothetical protein
MGQLHSWAESQQPTWTRHRKGIVKQKMVSIEKPAGPIKVQLTQVEKSILKDLLDKEQNHAEEISRIRGLVASLVTVIAGRGGAPDGARLSLDVDKWEVTATPGVIPLSKPAEIP